MISVLAFSPDGKTLASASWDYSVRLWDLPRGSCLSTFQGHHSEVWSLAFSPDGQYLVSGSKDGNVFWWPTRKTPKDDMIAGNWLPLGISSDSTTLAAVNKASEVAFFDLTNGALQDTFHFTNSSPHAPPHVTAISRDFTILVHGTQSGKIELLNTRTRTSLELKISDAPVGGLELSPDGHDLLASSGFWQPLRWWDLRTGTNILIDPQADRALFSPDSKLLAVFSRNAAVQLWDVPTHTLKSTYTNISFSGFASALSHDGSILATASGPNEAEVAISLWDTRTGRLLGNCIGHKQPILSLAFSPDSKSLASAGDDSTLKLWNVQTRQELLSIRKLGGSMIGLEFSPDGTILAGATGIFAQNGGIQLFRAPALKSP